MTFHYNTRYEYMTHVYSIICNGHMLHTNKHQLTKLTQISIYNTNFDIIALDLREVTALDSSGLCAICELMHNIPNLQIISSLYIQPCALLYILGLDAFTITSEELKCLYTFE